MNASKNHVEQKITPQQKVAGKDNREEKTLRDMKKGLKEMNYYLSVATMQKHQEMKTCR